MITRIAVVVAWLSLVSCGVVGPPVAPENVGMAATIERQKQLDAREAEQREALTKKENMEPGPEVQGQDLDLPPLRPVGAR